MTRRVTSADVREGAFLTDGERLYEVLRTWLPNGQVMLEDCSSPSEAAWVVSVTELVKQGMQVVRPAA